MSLVTKAAGWSFSDESNRIEYNGNNNGFLIIANSKTHKISLIKKPYHRIFRVLMYIWKSISLLFSRNKIITDRKLADLTKNDSEPSEQVNPHQQAEQPPILSDLANSLIIPHQPNLVARESSDDLLSPTLDPPQQAATSLPTPVLPTSVASASMTLQPPEERLETVKLFEGLSYQYNPQRPLSQGAGGTVFLATRTSDSVSSRSSPYGTSYYPEQAIVKKAKTDRETGKPFTDELSIECEFLKEISHGDYLYHLKDQLVQLVSPFDSKPAEGILVFEKADGSLNDPTFLTSLSLVEKKKIITDIGSSIRGMHQHSWTHNDVNLKNMLHFGRDKAKLCDFGSLLNFSECGFGGRLVRKPTAEEQKLLDQKLVNKTNFICTLDEQLLSDKKGFVIAAYSILVGSEKNTIPLNYQDELKQTCPDLREDDLRLLNTAFAPHNIPHEITKQDERIKNELDAYNKKFSDIMRAVSQPT